MMSASVLWAGRPAGRSMAKTGGLRLLCVVVLRAARECTEARWSSAGLALIARQEANAADNADIRQAG